MKIAGIISEYNPIHNGHVHHIAETRRLLGADTAIVCAMSGNFVQRGELAVFSKHARAEAAVLCGADLVVELPLPSVLSSAALFALGGVALLNALGVITHLSFGSEAGDVAPLAEVAEGLLRPEMDGLIQKELMLGVSYAVARQRAAYRLFGEKACLLETPNNILGIEYIKALKTLGASMLPVTVRRLGAAHDSPGNESASALRAQMRAGKEIWPFIPEEAGRLYRAEIAARRGPVFMAGIETALLARLRMLKPDDFAALPDASEGLERRLMRAALTAPTLEALYGMTKTKRYALSRLRRMVMCAALGLTASESRAMPCFARVLALNKTGMAVLHHIKETSSLPVITKPASAKGLNGPALSLFRKEAAATDFYVLACPGAENRSGGQEWMRSPRIVGAMNRLHP
ncbi:nucleotidyltransferase family protein [Oscillospiraceae bacterium WX1]